MRVDLILQEAFGCFWKTMRPGWFMLTFRFVKKRNLLSAETATRYRSKPPFTEIDGRPRSFGHVFGAIEIHYFEEIIGSDLASDSCWCPFTTET